MVLPIHREIVAVLSSLRELLSCLIGMNHYLSKALDVPS